MGHPEIKNETPFAFELVAGLDEEGREVVATVVKATLEIPASGALVPADEPVPVKLGGEYWGEPPEKRGFKFEPEGGFFKPATDVVLVGHAVPPRSGTPAFDVVFRVGGLGKVVRAVGDRVFYRSGGVIGLTAPRPIESIPLSYDRAYGGWDRSHPDPRKHDCEPRNPIGVGFHAKGSAFVERSPLPNLEDPAHPVREYDGRSNPAGFGFIGPEWQPRAGLAGTYDAAWSKSRMPLLPVDFKRQFWNAASPGLIAPGYLRGDEPVSVSNVGGLGSASFNLPGFAPPVCTVRPRYSAERTLVTNLDTVIVFADQRRVFLLWRGHTLLQNGLHAVRQVEVTCANARKPTRPVAPARPSNVVPLRAPA